MTTTARPKFALGNNHVNMLYRLGHHQKLVHILFMDLSVTAVNEKSLVATQYSNGGVHTENPPRY